MIDEERIASILADPQQGSASELYELGCAFASGEFAQDWTRDYKKAKLFFEQAGRKNHPQALCELGYLYETGQAGETNPQKAFECYRKAMELGLEEAIDRVRICYEAGIGVAKELSKAEELRKRYNEIKGN